MPHAPLRILHVLFSSRLAGSERYCADLANRQMLAGHEVHVVGLSSAEVRKALDARVHFHPWSFRFFRSFYLRRLVARLGIDVCHGHLSGACKAIARLSDLTATVATLHVGYKSHQHGRLDAVVCVNRTQAGRLQDYRGMVRTIPNWLPLQRRSYAEPTLRGELGIEPDAFVVGAVGRLHPSKGMDLLIRAFQKSAPYDAALVILGEGPQRAELERLSGDDSRIHFLGHRGDVRDCLRDCSVFVSPSREESYGLAILEAMSTGIPVIATAAEGPKEFLQDQPATLVDLDSVDALAEALARTAKLFRTGELAPVLYDQAIFDAKERLASISDFYTQVIKMKAQAGVKRSADAAVPA